MGIKKYLQTKSEREILGKIKSTKVTSRKVVGRGTLVLDAKEVTGTDNFKVHAKRAAAIVRARKSQP